ncbi:hypothetical protein EDD16DRAFT_1708694 [Pisolithus croceorrhizus]|nr:hypothetical protein EDD16DRAFT_1708694 [Pisolithus croceorrhizus]
MASPRSINSENIGSDCFSYDDATLESCLADDLMEVSPSTPADAPSGSSTTRREFLTPLPTGASTSTDDQTTAYSQPLSDSTTFRPLGGLTLRRTKPNKGKARQRAPTPVPSVPVADRLATTSYDHGPSSEQPGPSRPLPALPVPGALPRQHLSEGSESPDTTKPRLPGVSIMEPTSSQFFDYCWLLTKYNPGDPLVGVSREQEQRLRLLCQVFRGSDVVASYVPKFLDVTVRVPDSTGNASFLENTLTAAISAMGDVQHDIVQILHKDLGPLVANSFHNATTNRSGGSGLDVLCQVAAAAEAGRSGLHPTISPLPSEWARYQTSLWTAAIPDGNRTVGGADSKGVPVSQPLAVPTLQTEESEERTKESVFQRAAAILTKYSTTDATTHEWLNFLDKSCEDAWGVAGLKPYNAVHVRNSIPSAPFLAIETNKKLWFYLGGRVQVPIEHPLHPFACYDCGCLGHWSCGYGSGSRWMTAEHAAVLYPFAPPLNRPSAPSAPSSSSSSRRLDWHNTKYRKQNALLGQTGAGCTYEDLLSNDKTKNILAAITKDFPWWADLHGWWRTNPAYNNTFSAADIGQDFATRAVELFKLQPTPPVTDPELEDGEIEDDEDFSGSADSQVVGMSIDDDSPASPVFPPPCFQQAPHHPSLDLCRSSLGLPPPPSFFSERPSPILPSVPLRPLLPPAFISKQHPSPRSSVAVGEMISLNDHPPVFSHADRPKLQPSCPPREQPWDHQQKAASVPVTEESSDSDVVPSNYFSTLRVSSSSPSSPFISDDSNSKPSKQTRKHVRETPADRISNSLSSASMSFVQHFQQSQQERSQVKQHRLDLDYWKAQAKVTVGQEEQEFQLLTQCEKYAHELAMGEQEVRKMELAVKLEQLRAQNLALQRGIASGEDQGASGDKDVHSSPPSV